MGEHDHFPDSDTAPKAPPAGFNGGPPASSGRAWSTFANAVDAGIVTSFATSVGTRDARRRLDASAGASVLDYTTSVGGRIAAAEYMNEPTLAAMGGAPAGYDAGGVRPRLKVFSARLSERRRRTC